MKDRKGNYYDRNGDEITVFELDAKLEDLKYKFVKKELVNGYLISTAWLGVNMDHTRKGKPIIFETMIFKDNWGDQTIGYQEKFEDAFDYQERYETEEQARKGHETAVLFVKSQTRKK